MSPSLTSQLVYKATPSGITVSGYRTARTKSVKSEVWPLFVLRMRSQILRPFSRIILIYNIINENLRIMHVFLRLQPWILDFAKILQTRATSGSAGT